MERQERLDTHHGQQPPRRVRRLRAHPEPVLGSHAIEPDVLERFALAVGRSLRDGIVRACEALIVSHQVQRS